MNYLQGSFPIVCKEQLNETCFSLWVRCPELASLALPGQFVHIRTESFFLRRPISICEVDPSAGTIRLVFEIRGNGTAELAARREGDSLDLIGPLGSGFSIRPGARAIVVGGGIGTPPLLEVLKQYGGGHAIIGFRSAAAIILEADFRRAGKVTLCTDDGTAGEKGFVTGPLETLLTTNGADILLACGPRGMLQGVVRLAERFGIPCEVSLEERMGCGVGACLVCACKCVRDGKEFYAHVCTDGPVFDAKEVVWREGV